MAVAEANSIEYTCYNKPSLLCFRAWFLFLPETLKAFPQSNVMYKVFGGEDERHYGHYDLLCALTVCSWPLLAFGICLQWRVSFWSWKCQFLSVFWSIFRGNLISYTSPLKCVYVLRSVASSHHLSETLPNIHAIHCLTGKARSLPRYIGLPK
jgi:hypothetical protein